MEENSCILMHANTCEHAESRSGSSRGTAQRKPEWPVSSPQRVRETRSQQIEVSLLLLLNFSGFDASPLKFQSLKHGVGGGIPGRQGGHFVFLGHQ